MRPKLMSWKDVSKYIYYSDVLIVDLRDSGEYKKGHIRMGPGISLMKKLEGRMKQLRGYKMDVLYCDYWETRAGGGQNAGGGRLAGSYGGRRV